MSEIQLFICDRKKECNTSPFCGFECTQTTDPAHGKELAYDEEYYDEYDYDEHYYDHYIEGDE